MMMLADWAHAAYEAARRHDHDGVDGTLNEILPQGAGAVEYVCRRWMDRTFVVINQCVDMDLHRSNIRLTVELEPDHGDGSTTPFRQAPVEVQWIGYLFNAHMTRNQVLWDKLWGGLADDQVAEHVRMLVFSMALTATSYAEETVTPLYRECCVMCRVESTFPPMLAGDRTAVAHLN